MRHGEVRCAMLKELGYWPTIHNGRISAASPNAAAPNGGNFLFHRDYCSYSSDFSVHGKTSAPEYFAIFDPLVQRPECTPDLRSMKCPICKQKGTSTTPINSNYWNEGCTPLFADKECYPSVIRRYGHLGNAKAKEKGNKVSSSTALRHCTRPLLPSTKEELSMELPICIGGLLYQHSIETLILALDAPGTSFVQMHKVLVEQYYNEYVRKGGGFYAKQRARLQERANLNI